MKISFIGLGKLGLPCAEVVAQKGHDVTGYDVAEVTSDLISVKETIKEAVQDREIVFIAVPTPHHPDYDGRQPTAHLEPKDFSYDIVVDVLREANLHMNKDQLLVLISTVLPGTTRREFVPLVTNTRFVYNPYLIAMGTVAWDMVNPDIVMIGTQDGTETGDAKQLKEFYVSIMENKPSYQIGTWDECECIKVFYNTFISTKIGLVNMIQDVAERQGNIDVDVVTDALKACEERIVSPMYLKAGMGDGGACHPRDNIALRWLAKNLGLGYDLFESIMTAREKQAENMAKAILSHGKNVCFSSDSYKPGTNLVDGSYSLLVQYYIVKHGGTIVHGFDTPVQVLVRVHESDNITADNETIIFDPWRTYPKAENVVYYGK